MNALPKLVAAAALAVAGLGASAASAQGWSDDGYRSDWRGGPPGPYVNNGYGPGYGYNDPDDEVGESVIAICPRGYHLGRRGRLCWPN